MQSSAAAGETAECVAKDSSGVRASTPPESPLRSRGPRDLERGSDRPRESPFRAMQVARSVGRGWRRGRNGGARSGDVRRRAAVAHAARPPRQRRQCPRSLLKSRGTTGVSRRSIEQTSPPARTDNPGQCECCADTLSATRTTDRGAAVGGSAPDALIDRCRDVARSACRFSLTSPSTIALVRRNAFGSQWQRLSAERLRALGASSAVRRQRLVDQVAA